MVPDLVKLAELFLVPSSFLVAALGTADTNMHRAAVSLLGLVVSALWLAANREALAETASQNPSIAHTVRIRILARFPIVFLTGWVLSTIVHLLLAGRALGTNVL